MVSSYELAITLSYILAFASALSALLYHYFSLIKGGEEKEEKEAKAGPRARAKPKARPARRRRR